MVWPVRLFSGSPSCAGVEEPVRWTVLASALLVVAVSCLTTAAAYANSRIPGATGLAIHPTDEQQLLLGLTYGLALTRDGGASFGWLCEQQIEGDGGDVDPSMVVTGDGTLVVLSLTHGSVLVSGDDGCSFERAIGPWQDNRVVDLTLDPTRSDRVLALLSTGIGATDTFEIVYRNLLAHSLDHGRSWEVLAELPDDFAPETLEVAASDPDRIYVSGNASADRLEGIVERSDDGGLSWTRTTVPLPFGSGSMFISGIHPADPDRLWVRVPSEGDTYGILPARLWMSVDTGASFEQVGETGGGMLGFALSPQGDRVAFGGPTDGLFEGPSDGSAAPSQVSDILVTCLRWTTSGIYACAAEPGTPFSLGFAPAPTQDFEPLWRRRNSCRATCAPPSSLEMMCRAPWEQIAPLVDAICDGSSWMPDAGIDAEQPDPGPRVDGGGVDAGADAASVVDSAHATPVPSEAPGIGRDGGCAVAMHSKVSPPWWLGLLLMLGGRMRRLRSPNGRSCWPPRQTICRDRRCPCALGSAELLGKSSCKGRGHRGGRGEEHVGMHTSRRSIKCGRALRLATLVAGMGAVAAGCSGESTDVDAPPPPNAGDSPGAGTQGGAGSQGGVGTQGGAGMEAGTGTQSGATTEQPDPGTTTDGASDDSPGATVDCEGLCFEPIEAECGASDSPETGFQGDAYPGTVNCGRTLLADIPGGGAAQGSGHCAFVRTGAITGGGTIQAYSLADPRNPVMTDEEPTLGSSESMRALTLEDRAILVSGSGVYDVRNCEDLVLKGEIAWPSAFYQAGLYVAALNGHEIAISHDGMRVYSGTGLGIADIEDLDNPDSWTVKNWTCELANQRGVPIDPSVCEGPSQNDVTMTRQYSHTSDDNLDGTIWYGAQQLDLSAIGGLLGGVPAEGPEPVTATMLDVSRLPDRIEVIDVVENFPGHGLNWWRTPSGREFILGSNEIGGADSCVDYPRPVDLGNSMDFYIVEVTGNQFGVPFPTTMEINLPENCAAAMASGANPLITEHSVYNKNGAAFAMIEFGSAGLRVYDLRDGENPREVAYYNDGLGHVHSGVFHYDDARGIIIASGSEATHVLLVQPQIIEALGLPTPTDPDYPYE